MARSVRWMWPWALRHQRGAQCSAFERTRAKVAVCILVARAPQPNPTSRLKGTTRDVDFLRSDSRCRRCLSDLPKVFTRSLGSDQNSSISVLWLTFTSRVASLMLRWKTADTLFAVLSFRFQVSRNSLKVAMSLLSTPSTACQPPSVWSVNPGLSAYAYFLETVVGRSMGDRTDTCGTPLMRRWNLFCCVQRWDLLMN